MTSYASGASTTPLLGVTIGRQLALTTERDPSALALVSRHQGIRLSYGQLWEQVEVCARAFLDLGVAKGDRVGIWAGNCAEWLIVQYATARVGAILVNVNPAYRRHELRYALAKSGVSVLVSARSFRTTDYVTMLEEVRPELPQLRSVVLLGEGGARMTAWQDFLAGAAHRTAEEVRNREATLDFDDAINIQYTSGTTGAPKGATLTHHNILNNGYFVGMGCGYTASDVICVPVPLYHCFGMVMGTLAALTHGASVVYPETAVDPRATLDAVSAERCTSLYGVPTMFIAQLQHPEFQGFDLTSLRTGIMAGSPCPVEVMKQVIDRMHARDLTICYGMTETSPVSFQSLADDDLE